MLRPSKSTSQRSLFFSLGDSLDQNHPLYILAEKVDWSMFEREFSQLYSADNGAPAKPIRLMVGLLILILGVILARKEFEPLGAPTIEQAKTKEPIYYKSEGGIMTPILD